MFAAVGAVVGADAMDSEAGCTNARVAGIIQVVGWLGKFEPELGSEKRLGKRLNSGLDEVYKGG